MAFWVRYFALVILCIVGPLGVAFYVDSQSELERAKRTADASATAAPPALQAQLALTAHEQVGHALSVANTISDEKLMPAQLVPAQRGGLKPDGLKKLVDALAFDLPEGGFAWALDESGAIIARNGQANLDPDPERLTGHPLFAAAQLGYGQDGLLVRDNKPYLVAVAPVIRDGEARGAVFIGREIDASFVKELGARVGTELTFALKNQVIASSLPGPLASELVGLFKSTEGSVRAIQGGSLSEPLKSPSWASFLPLFVSKRAEGIAYASLQRPFVANADARWVISVGAASELQGLAERQQNSLGLMLVAFLISIFFGLTFHRSFVRPLGIVTEHLSDFTQGRGERELSDKAVSGPFKRLVKLINMTVQRTPTNFGFSDSMDRREEDGGDGLGLAMLPSMPPSAPPSQRVRSEPPASLPPEVPESLPPPPIQPVPRAPSTQARAPESLPAARAVSAPAAFDMPSFSMSTPSLDPPIAPPGLERDSGRPTSSVGASKKPTPNSARMASEIRGTPSNSLVDFNAAALLGVSQAPPRPFEAKTPIPLPDRAGSARPQKPAPAPAAPAPAPLNQEVDELFSSIGLASEKPGKADPFNFAVPNIQTSRMGGSAAMGGSAGLGLGAAAGLQDEEEHNDDFRSENTVVAAPDDNLLRASARDMTGTFGAHVPTYDTKPQPGEDAEDIAHFRETYERFVEMRKSCGEPTADLAFDRFVTKLRKNRDGLVQKYACRTVRFQVYEKDGKAALKATPVRA